MRLHWNHLVRYYTDESSANTRRAFERHELRLRDAEWPTYALLCCRFNDRDPLIRNVSSGPHAERRLLTEQPINTNAGGPYFWNDNVTVLERALGRWDARSDPIVTTLAINRSPCHRDPAVARSGCADMLVDLLNHLNRLQPVSCHHSRFILACRGLYRGQDDVNTGTEREDFERLSNAGWELCVLQFEARLPRMGTALQDAIKEFTGRDQRIDLYERKIPEGWLP